MNAPFKACTVRQRAAAKVVCQIAGHGLRDLAAKTMSDHGGHDLVIAMSSKDTSAAYILEHFIAHSVLAHSTQYSSVFHVCLVSVPDVVFLLSNPPCWLHPSLHPSLF